MNQKNQTLHPHFMDFSKVCYNPSEAGESSQFSKGRVAFVQYISENINITKIGNLVVESFHLTAAK